MRKLAFALLWFSVFAIAWEDILSVPGIGRISRVAGLVAFVAAVLTVLSSGTLRRLALMHVFMVLFVGWSALSLLWTIDLPSTVERITTYAQLAMLAWLVWEVAQAQEQRTSLLQAYVLGSYVSAIGTIANYLAGTEWKDPGRYAAAGFHPNDLGFFLALAIPMAWYLAVQRPKGLLLWVNRLYLPVGLAALGLTASRGALIPCLVALSIIPFTFPALRRRARVAVIVVVAASAFALARFVPDVSWQRLGSTKTELTEGSLTLRRYIWAAGRHVYLQNSLLGVGAGTFAIAVGPLLDRPRPAHNAFLAVLVEQGPIGVILFTGMFLAAFPAIRHMPPLKRTFWIVMTCTLVVGLMPRNWDYRKPTWLLLAVLAAEGQAALSKRREQSWRVSMAPVAPAFQRLPHA